MENAKKEESDFELRWMEMQKSLAKDGEKLAEFSGKSPGVLHRLHMAIGISSEVGEIIECITDPGMEREDLLEEIGDYEFYAFGLRDDIDLSREDVLNWLKDERLAMDSWGESMCEENRMAAASGRVLDLIKKEWAYEQTVDYLAENGLIYWLAKLEEAVMDICLAERVTRAEALEHNWNKLGQRYRDHKFTNEAAEARADKS
jgi:hypothetical protein